MSLDSLIARSEDQPDTPRQGCALVLMGGGARTAYQVGVLRALGRMLAPRGLPDKPAHAGQKAAFPFRWMFGTSAGALNAAYLAGRAGEGLAALGQLAGFWTHLRSERVYELSAPRWVRASRLAAGWVLSRQIKQHRALLNTMPLVDTLHREIRLDGLEAALDKGYLDAFGVTASSYSTGDHWTFCQTAPHVTARPWQRPGRQAEFQPITIEHLMASSAIPFMFPSVPLWVNDRREYFGDGSMRQLSPLSPALHFGASRILVIGVGQPQRSTMLGATEGEPDAGTIAGHAMASVFHDTLQADVEQALRVSETLNALPGSVRDALPYHPVEVVALQPSRSLDELAQEFLGELPSATRNTLVGLGVIDPRKGAADSAAAIASYLLFEPGFVHALVTLGEKDAWARHDELIALWRPQPSSQ
ncbi:patatin-like phospholipase family protein [Hydrogenophaga sp. 5NK40-0174]|uniref:patatin-like phospholipase family protein n=1 Tax=Hydrogenophaga sp. 5NK40-0174 TaxID=3127649 RepID=UPI00310890B8